MSMIIEQNIIPRRALRGGETIPAVGLGTFGSDKYDAAQVAEAVYGGIRAGYRLIDCAAVYQNEDHIGEALQRVISEGIAERKDLFITSKVWNDMHGEGKVAQSCEKSMLDLQLSYIDLFFVHWPFPNYHAPGCDGDSRNPDSKPFSVEEFMGTWRQCEKLVEEGKVRYLGMSNMTVPKLEAVLPLCRIRPAGILPIGYCPIGSPSRPERDRTMEDVADTQMPEILQIAQNHNIHPALVCLKWAVQRGQVPIPFSVKASQYVSNLRCITEDPLTVEEMELIRKADKNCRLIKGQVFLWPGAKGWEDLWDMEGTITC